jgi:hypothetical protein
MRESPAWQALSDNGRRLLDRLELEHMRHGGAENGALPCTYDDFKDAGIRRSSVAEAIREAVALGFLEVTKHGGQSVGGYRSPNHYRLTYLVGCGRSPDATHDWRKVQDPASALAKSAAHTRDIDSRPAYGSRTGGPLAGLGNALP